MVSCISIVVVVGSLVGEVEELLLAGVRTALRCCPVLRCRVCRGWAAVTTIPPVLNLWPVVVVVWIGVFSD